MSSGFTKGHSAISFAVKRHSGAYVCRHALLLQGKHLRFNETGKATESPQRTVLRGLPVAVGKYKRFN